MDIQEQKKLAKLAIEASYYAGLEIMKIYANDFDVEIKADNSPLTLADKNANDVITGFLEKTDLPILSEEGREMSFDERKDWEYYWNVDPLDGTKEFVKRNGNFTVNIALMYKSIPIFGIIYIPVSDDLYFGGADIGSFKHEGFSSKKDWSYDDMADQKNKLPNQELPTKYTIAASSSHLSKETQEHIQELENNNGDIELISRGSSLKICLVAEGAVHEYPRFAPTMEWDIAAGHGIILGVGKDIIDHSTNKSIQYNKENLLNNWFTVK
ncbi:MAG: 3'(2'), 5'-bisphosphate nucleotidase [Ulvibacter sp.]|jgi:3'(2'), 5'-bisphosphate nucleotidase